LLQLAAPGTILDAALVKIGGRGIEPRGDPERRLEMRRCIAILSALAVIATVAASPAAADRDLLRITPKQINFGSQPVGSENFDSVTVTNASASELRVLVSSALLDDFGFGLLPGSTCPALDSGGILAPGESCVAVVRFSPTEFFAGLHQTGTLTVTASDPATGEVLESVVVPVRGRGTL